MVCKRMRNLNKFAYECWVQSDTNMIDMQYCFTAFHKMSFITFLITSFIHMFVAYYIMKSCLNIAKGLNDASLKWKRRSMMLNVLSTLIACYFFYRHNKYCEPLGKILIDILIITHSRSCSLGNRYIISVYSMFALSEYGVVLSNMGYHLTAALDFATTRLLISGNRFRII